MKVAVLSESSADEAAVQVLVGSILGREIQIISVSARRAHGISGVFDVLPAAFKELHYHTDADGVVVVVDSDHLPIHEEHHEQPGGADERCRMCELRQVVNRIQGGLRPVPGRAPLKVAFGVAVPIMEAWYLCGTDPRVNEATWKLGLQARSDPYNKLALKKGVYGTERPSLSLETQRAVTEAQRLTRDLPLLERLFPSGFGALAQDLRRW